MTWRAHVVASLMTGSLLSATALAQTPQPAKSCRIAAPKVPAVDWRGQARYKAIVTVDDGRIALIDVIPQTSGVERRAQLSLTKAVTDAVRAATCDRGSYVDEHIFTFDLSGPNPEVSVSDSKTRP